MTTMVRLSGRFATRLQYTDARSRSIYIADKYAPILIGSVLEVGCRESALRALIHQPFRYVGVDRTPGRADHVVEIGREPLAFGDTSFDTVVCVDGSAAREPALVGELCRVARGHVILGLPGLDPSRAEGLAAAARADGFDVVQMDAEQDGPAWLVLGRSASGK
jgi:hypothetical protein